MKRQKHRKIFYVPGMISLALLFLLCLYFLFASDLLRQEGVIELGLADDYSRQIIKEHAGSFPVKRNYDEFVFDRFNGANRQELQEMRLALRKLKKENDTVNGIKIHFGKTTYQTFIDVIDIITIEDMPFYVNDKDDLYVCIPNTNRKSKVRTGYISLMNCGTGELMREQKRNCLEALRESEAQEIDKAYWKSTWPIGVAFLAIAFLNIYVWNRARKYNQKYYI
jgi:hypothetical protein